jgi:diguanylate cyclase (GGDEF)-like protein/PAS domain S-box-containing protein
MIEKTPKKTTLDTPNHSHDLLLALSRASQSIQRARTAEAAYRAIGDQIKSLGGDVSMFMMNDDHHSLTIVYTSYAPNFLRQAEKIVGISAIGYRFEIVPDDIYSRSIAAGKAVYEQESKKYIVAMLPKSLHFLADQILSILKVEQGILAPLRMDDETLGVMAVSGLPLTEDDIPAMESFAGQIAVSLHNVHLTQQMQNELSERELAEVALRESEERYRTLFDGMMDGIYRSTHEGKFLDVNPAMVKMFGYSSREEMLAVDIKKELYFAPEERGSHLLDTGQEEIDVYRMRRKDGSEIWVEDHGYYVHDEQGEILYHEGMLRDVTERKSTEEMLAKRARQLATVTDVSAAISANLEQGQLLQSVVNLSKDRFELYHAHIYLLNEAGNTLLLTVGAGEVGRQMVLEEWRISLTQERSLVARAARERIGVIANDIRQDAGFLPHPLLPDTRSEMAVPIIISDSLFGVLDVQANDANHFTEEDVRIMTTLAEQIAVAVQNARLFSERRQAEDELRRAKESLEVVNMELRFAFEHEQHMARTDTLTRINNRRNLFELAGHEFEVAKRYQQPLSIIMFDLDHFKQINDTYGHSIGDKMLERVAQVTHAQLRDVDIIARYGGEEFVIVLPVTNAQKAFLLAKRILENVSAIRLHTEHGSASITLSIGIAETIHEPQDESVENVIRRADEAMYAAKKAGRNCAMIFVPDE